MWGSTAMNTAGGDDGPRLGRQVAIQGRAQHINVRAKPRRQGTAGCMCHAWAGCTQVQAGCVARRGKGIGEQCRR